jgi:hypothetical protein
MKKNLTLIGLMLILSGCGGVEKDEVPTNKANQSFTIVNNEDEDFIEYKHKTTGCHYVEDDYNSDYLTQMFIEKNGVSIPLCVDLPINKSHKSFVIVNDEDKNFIEYKHIPTGCHYVESFYNSNYFTQMFIEKNGVSVPFCD